MGDPCFDTVWRSCCGCRVVGHPGSPDVLVPCRLLRLAPALPLRAHRSVPKYPDHAFSWLKLAPASAGPSPHPSPLPLNPVVPIPGCASRTRLASRRTRIGCGGPVKQTAPMRAAPLKHLGDACGRQPWLRRSQALTTSAALVVLRISSSRLRTCVRSPSGAKILKSTTAPSGPPHSMWTSGVAVWL